MGPPMEAFPWHLHVGVWGLALSVCYSRACVHSNLRTDVLLGTAFVRV